MLVMAIKYNITMYIILIFLLALSLCFDLSKASCILEYIGDDFCDDENNNAACNYDGGDCCGVVNKNYCGICACLDPSFGSIEETCSNPEALNYDPLSNSKADIYCEFLTGLIPEENWQLAGPDDIMYALANDSAPFIELTEGRFMNDFHLSSSWTLLGQGTSKTILDSDSIVSKLIVSNGARVHLERVTITRCMWYAVIVKEGSTLILHDVILKENTFLLGSSSASRIFLKKVVFGPSSHGGALTGQYPVYYRDTPIIQMLDCTIHNITGTYSLAFLGHHIDEVQVNVSSSVIVKRLLFQNNALGFYNAFYTTEPLSSDRYVSVLMENSTLENNYAPQSSLFTCREGCMINLITTSIINNDFSSGLLVFKSSTINVNTVYAAKNMFWRSVFFIFDLSLLSGDNLIMEDNYGSTWGSIFWFYDNTVGNVFSSTFSNNVAGVGGGVVMGMTFSQFYCTYCIFDGNSALSSFGHGGAIWGESNILFRFYSCDFTNNAALLNGGAIYVKNEAQVSLSSCILMGNRARYGGALWAGDNTIYYVSSVDLLNNTAREGGAIQSTRESKITLTQSYLVNNEGLNGGALSLLDVCDVYITYCSLLNNTATGGFGGAVFMEGFVHLNILRSTIDHNTAVTSGGALQLRDEVVLAINYTDFKGNSAGVDGGAIHSLNHDMIILATTNIEENTAVYAGGGINLYQGVSSDIITDDVTFTENVAQLGPAIFSSNPLIPYPPKQAARLFLVNNVGTFAPNPFASGPIRLSWVSTFEDVDMNLFSGSFFPSLELELVDTSNQRITLNPNVALMVLQVSVEKYNNIALPNDTVAELSGLTTLAALRGTAQFTRIRIKAYPGSFRVVIKSATSSFDSDMFHVQQNFTIGQCPEGQQMWNDATGGHFNICTPITCGQGCVNGLCTRINECVCTDGWSGVNCIQAICKICEHGSCVGPEQCNCDEGYVGLGCVSTSVPAYILPTAIACSLGAILIFVGLIYLIHRRHTWRRSVLESWIIPYNQLEKLPDNTVPNRKGSRISHGDSIKSGSVYGPNIFHEATHFKPASLALSIHGGNTSTHRHFTARIWKGAIVGVWKLNKSSVNIDDIILNEVVSIKRLHHPNITSLLGCCVNPKYPIAVVSEYCQKGSLKDILSNISIDLDWNFRFSLLEDLTRGLDYLHTHHIIHGRLRSSNCVIDSRWTLKVTEFGLHSFRTYIPTEENDYGNSFDGERVVDQTLDGEESTLPKINLPDNANGNSEYQDLQSENHKFSQNKTMLNSIKNNLNRWNKTSTVAPTMQSFYGIVPFVSECVYLRNFEHLYWTAPEHLCGPSNLSLSSDVYSFGVILFEVITRKLPYYDEISNPSSIIDQIAQEGLKPNIDVLSTPRPKKKLLILLDECLSWLESTRPTIPNISRRISVLNPNKEKSVVDVMSEMLERYANNLENIVAERTDELIIEKQRAEDLLLNILPAKIVDQLHNGANDGALIGSRSEMVSVFFSDIVSFTSMSRQITPEEVVCMLNVIFSLMDALTEHYHLTKIKTIGDAFMAACGVPEPETEQNARMAEFALSCQEQMYRRHDPLGKPLCMRMGMHCGPVVAGVVGSKKFAYDLWGDTVNMASRMESNGEAGRVCVSEPVFTDLCDIYDFETREPRMIKGQGVVTTYLLIGRTENKAPNFLSEEEFSKDNILKELMKEIPDPVALSKDNRMPMGVHIGLSTANLVMSTSNQ